MEVTWKATVCVCYAGIIDIPMAEGVVGSRYRVSLNYVLLATCILSHLCVPYCLLYYKA